jgi:DNA-binding PucR family transcriptional regulator
VAAEALLSVEDAEARQFAVRELGALDRDDAYAQRLRTTLLVWLQEHDRQRAAARLGVHPNTVAHRLRRCESLLGRGLRERAFELELALRLRDVLPSETPPCPACDGMIQMDAGTRGETWSLARPSI